MSEVFRVRTPEAAPEAPQAPPQRLELKSDELAGNESKASTPLEKEQYRLEIWEGEHKTKYINEFFNIKQYADEFGLKMQTSQIDNYIKAELEKRGYENNTENWEKIISEIENEIGSSRLELFKRIQKIQGYIGAVNRLNKHKETVEKYRNSITE